MIGYDDITHARSADSLFETHYRVTADVAQKDPVNRPEHYNKGSIECIDYLKDSLGDGFTYYLEGNTKKYLHRWRFKGGVEDLKKAQWYLSALIHEVERIKDEYHS